MPLKIEALLSSHKVMLLDLDEFGAYIKLLCHAWLNGGKLDKDATSNARAMQRLCLCNANDAERIIKNVLEVFFFDDGNGYLYNERQLEIWEEVHCKSLKAKEKAEKAALARWGKRDNATSNATSNQQAMLEQCQPKPKPKPKENKKKIERFIKPTLEEISEYCKERKNYVNPESFLDHYEANGWMVGKNKMKDWKATVRNWERRDQQPSLFPKQSGFTPGQILTEDSPCPL
jgi:uncharacterized protein YdaU (DUF1376 family)